MELVFKNALMIIILIILWQDIDPGDLTERKKLRAEKCPRPFSYYIKKAFPEMGVDARSFAWKGVN